MPEPASAPAIRHFDGRDAYEDAVDELLAAAKTSVLVFEPQLSPAYNRSRRYQALRRFIAAGRANQIRILVHDASQIVRHCPRLCQLQRQHAHAVHIHRTPEEASRISDPFCVTDQLGYVRKFHVEDARGITSFQDEVTALELAGRFHEMWELSVPALTATVLGL